ncbi:GspH/FimT family pseudopilin [Ectopseudomonas khazarica]|uniref:GspH/FimT family protein n=1 Tax=Ectopseudomonas khazarica TaxID=2502979 RepID=UPI001AEFFE97|nr:GspH/FimT family protein [Pseudomonas khazarica]QTS89014.1 GspH/FimT family pseudopilin [Pseudomonas khazarica]
MKTSHQKAHSLVELLVVVALLGIVITLSSPSLLRLIEQNRERALREELLAHLNFTRSQAILSQRPHLICGSSNGTTCDGNWNGHWLVMSARDQLLLRRFTPPRNSQLCWRGFGLRSRILFQANGMSSASNGRFSICGAQQSSWQIVLNRQGRLRVRVGDRSYR